MTDRPITGMVPRVNAAVPETFDPMLLDPAQMAFTQAMCSEHPLTPLSMTELSWITRPSSLLLREPLGSMMLTQAFRLTIDSALVKPHADHAHVRKILTTRTRQRLSRIYSRPQLLLERWLDDLLELLFEDRLSDLQWQAITHQVDLFGFSLRHYLDFLDLPNWKAFFDGVAPRTMPVSQSIEKSQLMFKGLHPRQQVEIDWLHHFSEIGRQGAGSRTAIPNPVDAQNDADYADFLGTYRDGLAGLHRSLTAGR